MLNIMCWLWDQPNSRTHYTTEHVNTWAAMVEAHTTIPHKISCVTDMPKGLNKNIHVIKPPGDFESVRIPTWGERHPQCLRRIALFRPDAADIFGERFVSMDIDCSIMDSLDPLFDREEDFVMYRGVTSKRPYNGSMLMMTAGSRSQVYKKFTPKGAVEAGQKYLGSDQAWISHVLGEGEATWGVKDGIHAFRSQWNVGRPRLMFFLGPIKPWMPMGKTGEAGRNYAKFRGIANGY